jgi:hypothetical protein
MTRWMLVHTRGAVERSPSIGKPHSHACSITAVTPRTMKARPRAMLRVLLISARPASLRLRWHAGAGAVEIAARRQ